MKRFVLLVAVLASAALVLALPPKAEADDTECTGTLTGGPFDNVIVPPGATCFLADATVSGNVKALENSRLRIDDSTIEGNVEGDKADIVQIFLTMVRQHILIKEGGPAEGPAPNFNVCGFGPPRTPCEALVISTTVQEGSVQIEKVVGTVLVAGLSVKAGNIKVEENIVPVAANEILQIQNSRVDQGNLQVFKNTGTGMKFVDGNTVGGSLQCFENQEPFAASGNTADSEEGQCPPTP